MERRGRKPKWGKKKENHRLFADWLFKELKYKTIEDWYTITARDIGENGGAGLLRHNYNNSPQQFLQAVYPEYEWVPWKFTRVTKGYWDKNENHRLFADWLFKELEYKTIEDWYNITQPIISKNGGGGLLKIYSPQQFLQAVYPDYEWVPWKFTHVTKGYWDKNENHRLFADCLFKELKYKTIEDWYKITKEEFKKGGGGGLLMTSYHDSPQQFLQAVYPDYEWVPWKFTSGGVTKGYWDKKENHRLFADWLFKELKYKTIEDWYTITAQDIGENGGGGLLGTSYHGSPQQFLQAVYPEYEWDISKFKKKYSHGQIEWLNYIKVSTPDIRHALTSANGEYSIPNSRYSADGYSETENRIFEYDGDYWHGNPQIYNQQDMNKVTKTTFGELYEKTQKKKQFCIDSGYKYVSIWESEWFRGVNAVITLQIKWKIK